MSRRPRVVFLDHVARRSGGEIALVRLVEALGDSVDAHVVLGEPGPLEVDLAAAGARVSVLPMADAARDVRKDDVGRRLPDPRAALSAAGYAGTVARLLRAERPDLVHTNSLKAHLYGGVAGRLARVPVLWHVRDRIADDYLPHPAVLAVRAAARVLPSAVLANSATTRATLPAAVRAMVVPDPLPAVVERVEPPVGPFTVTVVGRLAPWKGQHVLVEAFARAFPPGSDARLRVVGDALFGEADYAAALRTTVRDLGLADRVDFRGHRDDVWAELAATSVLVHCSVSPEPFGQVVTEGMAAGLPVLAAAAGGPAEVVTDGVDGLLVPPGDVGALAAALRRVEADPDLRTRLGAAARAGAARFAPDAVAPRVLDTYRRLLQR